MASLIKAASFPMVQMIDFESKMAKIGGFALKGALNSRKLIVEPSAHPILSNSLPAVIKSTPASMTLKRVPRTVNVEVIEDLYALVTGDAVLAENVSVLVALPVTLRGVPEGPTHRDALRRHLALHLLNIYSSASSRMQTYARVQRAQDMLECTRLKI